MPKYTKRTIPSQRTSIPLLGLTVHAFDIYGNKILRLTRTMSRTINGQKVTNTYYEPDWWVPQFPFSYREYIKNNFVRLDHSDSAVKFDTLKFTFADPEFIFVQKAGDLPLSAPREKFSKDYKPTFLSSKDYETPVGGVTMYRNTITEGYYESLKPSEKKLIYDRMFKDILNWEDYDNYRNHPTIEYPQATSTEFAGYSMTGNRHKSQDRTLFLLIRASGSGDKIVKYGDVSYELAYMTTNDSGDAIGFNRVWDHMKDFILDATMFQDINQEKKNIDAVGESEEYEKHSFKMTKDKRRQAFGIDIAWINKGAVWTIGYGNNSYNVFSPKYYDNQKVNYEPNKFTGLIDKIDISFPNNGIPEITIMFVETMYLLKDLNVTRYRKYYHFTRNADLSGKKLATDYTQDQVKQERNTYDFDEMRSQLRRQITQDKGSAKVFPKSLDVVFVNKTFLEIIKDVITMFSLDFFDANGGLTNDILFYYGVPVTRYKKFDKEQEPQKYEQVRKLKYESENQVEDENVYILYKNRFFDDTEYEWANRNVSETRVLNTGLIEEVVDLQRVPLVIWKGNQSAWDFLYKNILDPLNMELIQMGANSSNQKGRITLKHVVDPESIGVVGNYLRILDTLVRIRKTIEKIKKGKSLPAAFLEQQYNDLKEVWAGDYSNIISTPTQAITFLYDVKSRKDYLKDIKAELGKMAKQLEDALNELGKASKDIGNLARAKIARVITYDPSNTDKYEAPSVAASISMNRESMQEDYANIANDTNKVDKAKNLKELVAETDKVSADTAREARTLTKEANESINDIQTFIETR